MGKVSIDQALKHARLLAERGDHARARKAYGKILRTAPQNTEAKAGLAALISQASPSQPVETTLATLTKLTENGQFEEVVERAKTLASTHGDSVVFWNLYGIALRETKQLQDAITAFRKAASLKPENTKVLYNLALLHQRREEHARARELFQKITEMQPDWAKPHLRMGQSLKVEQRIQDALPHYQKASELAPDDPEIQNAYGLALSLGDQPKDAIPYFKKAVELKDDYAEAHFNLGNTLKKNDKILEALEEYRKGVRIDPEFSEAWQNLGNTLALEEDYDECIACYDKFLALQPGNTDVMLARGRSLIAAGDIDEAQQYLLEVIPAGSKARKFHFYLGRTYQAQGDLENSIHHFSEAYHLDRDYLSPFAALASMPKGHLSDAMLAKLDTNCQKMRERLTFGPSEFLKANVLRHLGNYDASWQHYVNANKDVFQRDRKLVKASLVDQFQVLRKLRVRPAPATLHSDEDPVSLFIVAPSRSGKTRLECLLATSPDVKRGYENNAFSILAKKVSRSHGLKSTNRLGQLPEAGQQAFVDKYRTRLRNICRPHHVFTDTSPHRVLNLWEVANLVPNSYFVFVERNPVDTAVAIFQKHYRAGANHYAYHPETIRYYLTWYRDMRKVLLGQLEDRAISIEYTDLLLNPHNVLHRIEDLLGLSLECETPRDAPKSAATLPDPFRDFMLAMPKAKSLNFLLGENDQDDTNGSDSKT